MLGRKTWQMSKAWSRKPAKLPEKLQKCPKFLRLIWLLEANIRCISLHFQEQILVPLQVFHSWSTGRWCKVLNKISTKYLTEIYVN